MGRGGLTEFAKQGLLRARALEDRSRHDQSQRIECYANTALGLSLPAAFAFHGDSKMSHTSGSSSSGSSSASSASARSCWLKSKLCWLGWQLSLSDFLRAKKGSSQPRHPRQNDRLQPTDESCPPVMSCYRSSDLSNANYKTGTRNHCSTSTCTQQNPLNAWASASGTSLHPWQNQSLHGRNIGLGLGPLIRDFGFFELYKAKIVARSKGVSKGVCVITGLGVGMCFVDIRSAHGSQRNLQTHAQRMCDLAP